MSKAGRPTLSDVARLSGVSYQTVSRVLNNHPYVSDDTRLRVQAAIDALGYRPNKAATKLASKSSKTIALIVYGSWFHGPVETFLNVELAARTSGYDVILINVTESLVQVAEALEHAKAWAVEGILMIVPVRGLTYPEVLTICGDTPVVQIDAQRSSVIPSVVTDDIYGMEQIVEHLISLGHRQFFEIGGPQNWFSAQVRHQACEKVFESHGLQLPAYVEANWTTAGGYQATRRWLEKEISFTAIISANDNMAFGALRALHEAGLVVPRDVSIVGFDDIPEAAYCIPPLTSVRQNYIQLGITGFEYLMQLMDDPETPLQQHVISPKVVFRESTGPLLVQARLHS